MSVTPNPDHPAKYTPEVLTQLRAVVAAEARRLGRPPTLLDPFAGTGRIHELRPLANTYGVEIEPEWAACHPDTICGDAMDIPEEWRGWFDIIATSVVYGNRFSDHHVANDSCKKCDGTGVFERASCPRCKGTKLSPRKSYKTSLGRDPHKDSSATMQWGPTYRDFHKRWIGVALEELDDGGLFIVNIKNHERQRRMQHVVEWWMQTLIEFDLLIEAVLPVPVRGMRFGANYSQRSTVEMIVVMRKPLPPEITE